MPDPQVVYKGYFRFELVDTPQGRREVLHAPDSVSILLYDNTSDRFRLVRQPRAAMIRPDNPDGMITELVAGRFDGDYTLEQLIIKEVWEEAGIDLPPRNVEILNNGVPMAVSAGATTERAYLAYAWFTPDMIVDEKKVYGAPGEGEEITPVWIDADTLSLMQMDFEDVRVFALIYYIIARQSA